MCLVVSACLLATPSTFMGFLPVKGIDRKSQLSYISNCPHSVVFFEAPHRILRTMQQLADTCGPAAAVRQCVCCRELTKMHEEVWRGTLLDCLAWLQGTPGGTKPVDNEVGGRCSTMEQFAPVFYYCHERYCITQPFGGTPR